MTNYELFKRDPLALFNRLCDEAELKCYKRGAFIWSTVMPRPYLSHGRPVTHGYGKYTTVTPKDLEGRTYEWNYFDSGLGVFWTDVWFIPTTRVYVPRSSEERGLNYKQSCLVTPDETPDWAKKL